MRLTLIAALLCLIFPRQPVVAAEELQKTFKEQRRNNLVAELLDIAQIRQPRQSFAFQRARAGWVFLAAHFMGKGTIKLTFDQAAKDAVTMAVDDANSPTAEIVRRVGHGDHEVLIECDESVHVERLVIRAIPDLIHCGLGYDPMIKSYGHYDLEFLKRDVLPNVTTFIVPPNIKLSQSTIDDLRRQGKRFVAGIGINGQSKTAAEHVSYWNNFFDEAPFLDGLIIDEFIVNNPSTRPGTSISAERQRRRERERQRHHLVEQAFRQLHAKERTRDKTIYAYVGGTGNTLNQEMIGSTFVRTAIDGDDRIALERYVFERSSEQGSAEALRALADGIADWESRQPGVKDKMFITFGLFSMPPGGINKLPNVDYHVWMDQQMNVVANDPKLSGIAGVNWWTSLVADEETVRFVGKLYRHYCIEGRTEMLTRDPLFLTHLQNADFEHGLGDWSLQPAAEGTIRAGQFPRYGRIQGRYMGLGREADPERIGDSFLVMKRSEKGPNKFSQPIKNLEPGRLYSLKMLTCNYQDLTEAKSKRLEEVEPFVGNITLEGVDVDEKRSFREIYASSPEPPIPVWITYHWTVFRAKTAAAQLTVSDWVQEPSVNQRFGQEQTFNFLELQPYHD